MEWSDIRVFLQVVREGTLAGATHSLHMDHSTISRRITRLEREIGVSLFDRAGRRLTITNEGMRLAQAAEKLESIVLREVLSLSESQATISGRVRIGTTEEFGVHFLAPRLASVAGEHAKLEIELVAMPRNFSLATREVDICVGLDRPVSGDVRFKKLTSFALGLYCSADYFGSRQRPTSAIDLASETHCGYIQELLHSAELECKDCDQPLSAIKYRTTSVSAQLAIVLSGSALAVLPCFIAATQPQLQRVLEGQVAFERDYWLSVHEDLANSPRVRIVMDAIGRMVGKERHLFQDPAARFSDQDRSEDGMFAAIERSMLATPAVKQESGTVPHHIGA